MWLNAGWLRVGRQLPKRWAADLGADRTLVSLTHGRDQAAAAVLLLKGGV